jgi:hypothetical protein
MSECVVRMEMPNSCPCELAGGYDIPMPCFAGHGIPKRCKEFDECVEKGTKPDWCPIICSLPDGHGRLVDADAFISTIRPLCEKDKFAVCTLETVKRLMVKHINNAPTIVPAESET